MNTKPRAVVIGGAGFIGSYVVHQLISENYNVHVFDNLSSGSLLRLPKNISFYKGDIRNFNELKNQLEPGDTVFHLAAFTSVPKSFEDPLAAHEINILGTYNVFEAAREKKVKMIIFSSSAAVYGSQEGLMKEEASVHPESPYALHKVIGEQLGQLYATSFNVPTTCLRYFNVYGPGNNEEGSYAPVTARFAKAKRENRPLPIVGDGNQTRDFIHVKDVARANICAAKKLVESIGYNIYNISSGKESIINDIANMVGGAKEYLPARTEIKFSCGDNTKAKNELRWTPQITLKEGLQELL